MRTLLVIALLVTQVTSAFAEDTPAPKEDLDFKGGPSRLMPGVRENGRSKSVFMSVILGKINSDLYDDNYNRGMTENSGWAYGLNFRGEVVTLQTAYGGDFGFTMDLDVFLTTPGVVEGPAQPRASILFMGLTPALALGLVKTKSFEITGEIGFPLNTDFYGFSGGGIFTFRSFYLGYRVRSGKGWHGTEVLDERVRIGFGNIGSKVLAKSFFGLEVIDGYSEDERGRADLRSMFRGGYNMVSLVISVGK